MAKSPFSAVSEMHMCLFYDINVVPCSFKFAFEKSMNTQDPTAMSIGKEGEIDGMGLVSKERTAPCQHIIFPPF